MQLRSALSKHEHCMLSVLGDVVIQLWLGYTVSSGFWHFVLKDNYFHCRVPTGGEVIKAGPGSPQAEGRW